MGGFCGAVPSLPWETSEVVGRVCWVTGYGAQRDTSRMTRRLRLPLLGYRKDVVTCQLRGIDDELYEELRPHAGSANSAVIH